MAGRATEATGFSRGLVLHEHALALLCSSLLLVSCSASRTVGLARPLATSESSGTATAAESADREPDFSLTLMRVSIGTYEPLEARLSLGFATPADHLLLTDETTGATLVDGGIEDLIAVDPGPEEDDFGVVVSAATGVEQILLRLSPAHPALQGKVAHGHNRLRAVIVDSDPELSASAEFELLDFPFFREAALSHVAPEFSEAGPGDVELARWTQPLVTNDAQELTTGFIFSTYR